MVLYWANKLAKSYINTKILVLRSAVYIHDIGRTIKDEGHPYESAKIAQPFLEKIGVEKSEIDIILEAVRCHDKKDIFQAKSIEAKILFDADKLQIVSLYGFMRCLFWLIDERKMDANQAVIFLFEYVKDINQNYLQTPEAKAVASREFPKIELLFNEYFEWQKNI